MYDFFVANLPRNDFLLDLSNEAINAIAKAAVGQSAEILKAVDWAEERVAEFEAARPNSHYWAFIQDARPDEPRTRVVWRTPDGRSGDAIDTLIVIGVAPTPPADGEEEQPSVAAPAIWTDADNIATYGHPISENE